MLLGNLACEAGYVRVLIVDDCLDGAFTLSRLLEFSGHETRTAIDGEEALQVASDFQPEVVFLDLWLPKIDGYEVAKRLRQTMNSDRIRIIALSGANPDPAGDREAGFDFRLMKPASLNQLLEAMGAGRPKRSEADPDGVEPDGT